MRLPIHCSYYLLFALPLLVACGNKSNKNSVNQANPAHPNSPLVPIIGNWKGSCLKSGNNSSLQTRLVFKITGEMSIINSVFLSKADCSTPEDYAYRFSGSYQVGDVRQSSPPFTQNFGATFSSDVYLTLKTNEMVLAFNGGPLDSNSEGWKINIEQKASPSTAETYRDALNSLKSVFSNNYYKVQANQLSIGNTTVAFMRE